MAMSGLAVARKRRCAQCDMWWLCAALERQSSFCVALGIGDGQRRLMLPEVYETGTCPLSYWGGLKPVDVAAEQERLRQKMLDHETAGLKALVDALLPDTLDEAEITAKLEALAQAGLIRFPEAAAEVVEYVTQRDVSTKP